MSRITSGKPEPGYEGVGLAAAMRDCLLCGVLVLNGPKGIIALTPEARRILRCPASEEIPLPLDRLPVSLQRILRETLAAGRGLDLPHLVCGAGDGSTLTLRVNAWPVRLAEPDPLLVVTLHDLSSAIDFEEHLQRLDRLSGAGTLSASLAHEIKNALVAGKVFFDLLLEKHQDLELAEIVKRELRRIDTLVTQMLRLAAPGRPELAPVHVRMVLEHALRLVQHQVQEKSITLQSAFTAEPDRVQGDEYQLEQAFLNLLLNALEASGPGGTLQVTTALLAPAAVRSDPVGNPKAPAGMPDHQPGHGMICITIQDTGLGIPAENFDRLFEPFFTTKEGGTGLGLAITRRIIRQHRGEIAVHSEPGRGATFRILLPALGM